MLPAVGTEMKPQTGQPSHVLLLLVSTNVQMQAVLWSGTCGSEQACQLVEPVAPAAGTELKPHTSPPSQVPLFKVSLHCQVTSLLS